ncbi:glucose 1-dehydrogenase [Roseomonas sp. GCM10028921]
MGRVQGKVAVVTGAGSGLGAATARTLAREGARVAITDIQVDDAEREAEAIRAGGHDAIALVHDVADEADWTRVIADVLDRFGRLDVLVNNAGIAHRGPPEEETLERWRGLMAVNLDGVFLGTKHAIRAMAASQPTPGGSIVNISSIAGIVGLPSNAAYSASKGGVRLYTKAVALHCAGNKLGIRVNSIHPGYILTPLIERGMQAAPDPEARLRELTAAHPIGHLGTPDDVAYGVLYLASDEAKFVTGAELVIDGGYTAQ